MPLDTFVTISWRWTTVSVNEIPHRMRRALDAMRHWSNRHGQQAAWVYVHEAPGGAFNTHMLCHLDPRLRLPLFEAAQQWFRAFDDSAILVEPRRYPGRKDTRLQYMTKGTDQITAGRFNGSAKPQGTIPFKRCGTSLNIGKASQRKAMTMSKDNR